MKKPLVSILIPVYNSEKFIKRAVDSAAHQTYPKIEIIIVDNASTDQSWKIIQELKQKYPDLYIAQNKLNIGPVRNWIKCLELCQGEFIKFLFSDDWLESNAVEDMITPMLLDASIGFSYSAVNIHYHDFRNMQMIASSYKLKKDGKRQTDDFVTATILGDEPVPYSPCCALFRKSDVESALSQKWDDEMGLSCLDRGIGSDILIFLYACEKHTCFFHIADSLVNFTGHQESITFHSDRRILIKCYKDAIWFHIFGNVLNTKKQKRWMILMFLNSVASSNNPGLTYLQKKTGRLARLSWYDLYLIMPMLGRLITGRLRSFYLRVINFYKMR